MDFGAIAGIDWCKHILGNSWDVRVGFVSSTVLVFIKYVNLLPVSYETPVEWTRRSIFYGFDFCKIKRKTNTRESQGLIVSRIPNRLLGVGNTQTTVLPIVNTMGL